MNFSYPKQFKLLHILLISNKSLRLKEQQTECPFITSREREQSNFAIQNNIDKFKSEIKNEQRNQIKQDTLQNNQRIHG